MITYITKNEMEIQKIANLALKKELYVSWEWCLYGLLSAIESSSKEDKNYYKKRKQRDWFNILQSVKI